MFLVFTCMQGELGGGIPIHPKFVFFLLLFLFSAHFSILRLLYAVLGDLELWNRKRRK